MSESWVVPPAAVWLQQTLPPPLGLLPALRPKRDHRCARRKGSEASLREASHKGTVMAGSNIKWTRIKDVRELTNSSGNQQAVSTGSKGNSQKKARRQPEGGPRIRARTRGTGRAHARRQPRPAHRCGRELLAPLSAVWGSQGATAPRQRKAAPAPGCAGPAAHREVPRAFWPPPGIPPHGVRPHSARRSVRAVQVLVKKK